MSEAHLKYEGRERRETPMHMEPLAECIQRYNNIVEKLEGVIQRLDSINGRYLTHLEEAIPYRALVSQHQENFKELAVHRRFVMGIQASLLITIILQILGFAYLYGGLSRQVEIDSKRLDVHSVRMQTIMKNAIE